MNRTSKNTCLCTAYFLGRREDINRQYKEVKSIVSSMLRGSIEKNKVGNGDRECWVAFLNKARLH